MPLQSVRKKIKDRNMTTEFTGAIITPLMNQYRSVYGWTAICFPHYGRYWLESALPSAINGVITEKWESIDFALKLDIRSSWDGWDPDFQSDVHQTTIADSLDDAVRIAALNEGYKVNDI